MRHGLALLLCASVIVMDGPRSAVLPAHAGAQPQAAAADGVRDTIRAIIAGPGAGLTRMPLSPADRGHLVRLYDGSAFTPLWVTPAGRPNAAARQALTLLDSAEADGLDPLDYETPRLRREAAALETATGLTPAAIAAFDTHLSAQTLRYLRHLHQGRLDPRTLGFHLDIPPDDHDYAAIVRSAASDGRIAELAETLAPPLILYRSLRQMLARYRAIAADEGPLPVFPAATVRPGDAFADAVRLHHRLVLLGDLPPGAPAPAEPIYDEGLAGGVRHFQMRHGLEVDGLIGRQTRAALHVPIAARARQIVLALERLRWLPHLDPDRFLAVNIPMFRVWGWGTVPADGAPEFSLGVIVGRALRTQTPVLVRDMRHVIFRPYWDVPVSILRGELLPAVRKDPDYFRRHDFEIVAGPGDNAPVVAQTPDAIDRLARGELRVRQRPGPRNALGLVKFVFPNDEQVYMHGTPATELFSRTRRDFSHGCVRVEDPVALAEWVLAGEPGWTRDRILAAMQGPRPLRVNLRRPIQVILFYITAVVMPDDGTIHFADDIYGHDARLDRALAR